MTRDEFYLSILEFFDEEIENGENLEINYPKTYGDCLQKLMEDLRQWHIKKYGSTNAYDRTKNLKKYNLTVEEVNEIINDNPDDYVYVDLEELGLKNTNLL